MRIAQIAPLAEAVPPKFYGGTERVVAALVEELVDRGHEVTLFASGDSETSANLVPVIPEALRSLPGAVDPLAPLLAMLEHLERVHAGLGENAAPRLALESAMLRWPMLPSAGDR